jgi:hypothetical protein
MTIHETLCRAIWNNTYKHDTLMEWQEIKPGSLHHQRVVAAAKAAYTALAKIIKLDVLDDRITPTITASN